MPSSKRGEGSKGDASILGRVLWKVHGGRVASQGRRRAGKREKESVMLTSGRRGGADGHEQSRAEGR